MKTILITILFFYITSICQASDRYYIVDFGATWCGPCQQMKSDSWPDKRVQEFITKSEAKFYDVDIDKYPVYKNSWRVNAYPTTVIAYGDGDVKKLQEINRVEGYMDADTLLKFLQDNIPIPKKIDQPSLTGQFL